MTVTCSGLRIGGSISGSSLTGGTVIGGSDFGITSWGGQLGHPGRKGGNVGILNGDGTRRTPNKTSQERFLTLNVAVWDRTADGGLGLSRQATLESNIDTLLALVDGGVDETCIVEHERADGFVRWIEGEVVDAFELSPGPLFSNPHAAYSAAVILRCAHPYWQSERLFSETILGSDGVVVEGNKRVTNMTLVFSGDGILTHVPSGDTVEIDGSSGAVTVDVGAGTVLQAGLPADGLLIPSNDPWQTWNPGPFTLSATVSTVVSWRSQWL